MKKSLRHLPKHKQEELKLITSTIREFSPDIQMIILFGSYARGNWVEDKYVEDGITFEYCSDYDVLILVGTKRNIILKGFSKRIRKKLKRIGIELSTHVSTIGHTVDEINNAILQGNYFFCDIKKEGVILYDSGKYKLAKPKKLNLTERIGKAQSHFESYFQSSNEFFCQYDNAIKNSWFSNAAFQLHQATERLYHTILLVFTDYKPKLHDIEELSAKSSRFDSRINSIFPRKTARDQKLFYLLKRAYTEARYNMQFKVSKDDLEILANRVKKLQALTKKICMEKIKSMTKEKDGNA